MLVPLRRLGRILTRQDAGRFALLLAVILGSTVAEVVGIAAVLPFMQLVANPDALESNALLAAMYRLGGFESERQMLLWTGVGVMALFVFSRCLAAYTFWLTQHTVWSVAHGITMRVLLAKLQSPYERLMSQSSTAMLRRAVNDVNSLVMGVILAGSESIAHLTLVSGIFGLLFYVRPTLALAVLAIFGGAYLVIHQVRTRYLAALGEERIASDRARFVSFSEAMTGVKAIRTEGAERFFLERFERASKRYNRVNPRARVAIVLPRYLVEILAFGGVILTVVLMLATERELLEAIPVLSLFALAGYRILPSLERGFAGVANVTHNLPAIENVRADIARVAGSEPDAGLADGPRLAFDDTILLDGVAFRYTSSHSPVLSDVNLRIPKHARIAFVGPTGSGKTTLVDILVGLLAPTDGTFSVDGVPVTPENGAAWRRCTAYVPQDVFLYDASVTRNIAFGIEEARIDHERVRHAARIAQAHEFIEGRLPDGYETRIGERGVRLSGGQRQRLGLARAFYRTPDVLLLDEATSALDGITEEKVMHALRAELPQVTVIMVAHRLSTVRWCDRIYLVSEGRIVDEGSHEELLESSDTFRQMVERTS